MRPQPPPYFDGLIAAYRAGHVGRDVHLGYWDTPPSLGTNCAPDEFEAAQARLTERMIGLAPLLSGQSVLDVGCGFGGTLAMINARLDRMSLTGANIDRRQLELCRGIAPRTGNALTLVEADACALPFSDAAFDQVVCVEAMFHFRSRQAFLAEAARLLRRDGSLTISDILLRQPGASAPWDVALLEAVIRHDYGPWPQLWIELPQLRQCAAAEGLDLTVSQDWTAATLPSYRIVAPDDTPDPLRQPDAAELFRWLHMHGWLNYQALAFRRR